jgi:hypothetical protein
MEHYSHKFNDWRKIMINSELSSLHDFLFGLLHRFGIDFSLINLSIRLNNSELIKVSLTWNSESKGSNLSESIKNSSEMDEELVKYLCNVGFDISYCSLTINISGFCFPDSEREKYMLINDRLMKRERKIHGVNSQIQILL